MLPCHSIGRVTNIESQEDCINASQALISGEGLCTDKGQGITGAKNKQKVQLPELAATVRQALNDTE
jgi:hypothetical protein